MLTSCEKEGVVDGFFFGGGGGGGYNKTKLLN